MDKIGPALAMLAPIIMGYIGQQKQASNTGAGGLGDLLGGIMGNASNEAQASSGNPITDLLGSVLGGGSGNQQNQGGLGGLLGGLFGK